MATAKIGNLNQFIWQYNGTTYQLVGCATSLEINRANNSIDISCQMSTGGVIGAEYGSQKNSGSISGLVFAYDTTEETTLWSYEDFRNAMETKTKVRLRTGEANTGSGKKLEDFTAVITSLSRSTALTADGQETYNVSYNIDGAITQVTLP